MDEIPYMVTYFCRSAVNMDVINGPGVVGDDIIARH